MKNIDSTPTVASFITAPASASAIGDVPPLEHRSRCSVLFDYAEHFFDLHATHIKYHGIRLNGTKFRGKRVFQDERKWSDSSLRNCIHLRFVFRSILLLRNVCCIHHSWSTDYANR